MSTQFDTGKTPAVRVMDNSASDIAIGNCANTTNWSSPRNDHQQLASHIAVHTPIHAPRGASSESQSIPSYSKGSPQAGFHVPVTAFSTATSTSCATSTPYPRQLCIDQTVNGRTNSVSEKIESELMSENGDSFASYKNSAFCNNALQNEQHQENISLHEFHVKTETEIRENRLLQFSRSNSPINQHENPNPTSILQLNAESCLLFNKQQQQKCLTTTTNDQKLSSPNFNGVQQQHNSQNDESFVASSSTSVSELSSKISNSYANALAAGIAAPRPLRSDTTANKSYENNKPIETIYNEDPQLHSMLDYADCETANQRILREISSESASFDVERDVSNSNADNDAVNGQNNNDNTFTQNSDTQQQQCSNNPQNNRPRQFYSIGKSGSRTFFRAPGLEPPDMSQMSVVDSGVRICHICSFSCKSTFHYNSHMNTHGDHQCTMCNYTSRTEGRLRKHMRESHSHEDRVRAGLEEADVRSSMQNALGNASPPKNTNLLLESKSATTMASIVSMVNRATAAASLSTTTAACTLAPISSNPTRDLLGMSEISTHNSNFSSAYSDAFANLNFGKDVDSQFSSPKKEALEQIKALTPLSALNKLLGISTVHNEHASENQNDRNAIGFQDPVVKDENTENEGSHTTSSKSRTSGQSQQPVVRRSGRPKIYRCKQCQHVSTSKEQSWAHNKTHIPLDKQLTCSQCGFVTEYKHHLEYHMRNHKGSKPFRCSKCAYTCVNKSMLNSHMKSHTPVYQYRCKDCSYQTKYCHSLKMHLDKYRHIRLPGTVEIDSDGEEKPISEGEPEDYGMMEGREWKGDMEGRESRGEEQRNDVVHSVEMEEPEQSTTHANLNSMLLQPAANIQQYSEQLQQYSNLRQLEHVNEILRAANQKTFSCTQCEYVTASQDEFTRHNVAHLISKHQNAPQQCTSLASLYQNLAAAQQQNQNSELFVNQQQQTLSSVLGPTNSELLNGILQTDSSTKEIAAQIQQSLLRQAAAQQQQEKESNRYDCQAVVAAMAAAANTLANGNLGTNGHTVSNSVLTTALLNQCSTSTSNAAVTIEHEMSTNNISTSFATVQSQHQQQNENSDLHIMFTQNQPSTVSGINSSSAAEATHTIASSNFHNFTNTNTFNFGSGDEELQLAHSLSPIESSGRRGSVGSASTSGGDSTSKTCSVSPGSESGSRKRKPSKIIKVDQISAKLRDQADIPRRESSDHRTKPNVADGLFKSSTIDCGGLRTRSNTNGSGSGEESNFSYPLAQNRENEMPHSCQHCMIAFRDLALYQIHLGYHGYDMPFKCNRCGHVCDTSLEFNLHLYQALHD